MNCPWINTTEPGQPWYTDRAPCQDHYSMDDAEIEWGVNTGVCNVPSWGENGIDYGIVNKYLNPKDNNRDDFVKLLSYGEWLTMKERATD